MGLGPRVSLPFELGTAPSCFLVWGEGTQAWSPDPLSPQAQRPGVPQFPLKDGVSHEEKGEREEAEEDSYLKLCAPQVTATSQSTLQKVFRATDTVGKSPALAGS